MNSSHYVFIYGTNIGVADGRDEIEDSIEELSQGFAEVTGGGAGESGWNIDVEIKDENQRDFVLTQIAKALVKYRLPLETILDVDGNQIELRSIYRETGTRDSASDFDDEPIGS